MSNFTKDPSIVAPFTAGSRAPGPRVSFQFWRQPVYQLQDGSYWHPGADGPTYLVGYDSPESYLYFGLPLKHPFTPGKATVHVRKARDVDKKKASGSNGARVTIHGADLAAVEIELLIWTPEQLRQLDLLWARVFPPNDKGSPPAFDVQHPKLSLHHIKALQFIGGDGPEIDALGRGVFRMTAIEFAQPSKKNATKTEVAPSGSLLDAGATPTTPGGFASPGANPSNLGPR